MSKKRFISLILFFIILSTSLVPLKPVQAEGSKKIEVGNSVQEGLSKEKEKELLGKLEKVKGELKDQKKEYDENLEKFRGEFAKALNNKKTSYLNELENKEIKEAEAKEITVSEDGDIKTIQEALDMATQDSNIEKIKIKAGTYTETDLTLLKSNGELLIEGEEGTIINGNILLINMYNGKIDSDSKESKSELPNIRIKNIIFDGEDNKSEILDNNIGIGGSNISLNLENIEIKNYYHPIVIDSPEKQSSLNINNIKINYNISDLLVLNSNADISNLIYEYNNGGLNFISNKDLMDHEKLSVKIKSSKIKDNSISSGTHSNSLINIRGYNADLDKMEINSNTIIAKNDYGVRSLIYAKGKEDYETIPQSELFNLNITNSKIENNKTDVYNDYDSFIVASDMDIGFSDLTLDGNNMNHNLIFNSDIDLKNIKQVKDGDSKGVKYFIESYGPDKSKFNKLSVDEMEIYNTDKSEKMKESIIIGMDVKLKNININSHNSKSDTNLLIKDSLINLEEILLNESGSLFINISGYLAQANKIGRINGLEINLKDSETLSENELNILTEDGIYQFEDIEIKKESFNNDSKINLKSDLLGYKDIVLENTGPFITDLSSRSAKEKSLNQLFMENIKINNKITSNQNYDIIPLAILGEGDLDLQLKDISITGEGNIVEYLYLDNLGKVDVYQLKGLGHNIFSALKYDDIDELNFYNSTLDNRNLVLSMYPNIDLNRTQVNMYNTIFLAKGLDKVVMDNSKVEFKNSNLLEDLSQVNPNFVNDASNIFGEPDLDDIGYPKEGSIVIDKGNNEYAKNLEKDLAGKNRLVNEVVDLGVYEYNPEDPIDPENPPIDPENPPVDPPTDPEKPPIEPENPIDPEDPPIDPDPVPVDPPEIKGEHKFYMEGFDDSSLRPNANITRHETAIVLYRILDSKIIDENYIEKADFKDIGPNHWGQDYIATLVKIGIVEGRPNNTFDPKKPITRAEFAKMLYEFDHVQKNQFKETNKDFTDIKGHWAEKYIKEMARKGWIEGYDDGSFKPNKPISRIEVMIMVNRILNRKVDLENTLDGVKSFTDVDKTYKYYTDVLEATNSHDYKIEKGKEIWTKLK